MRIGLFSDVHGNIDALHRTLALLRGELGVDALLCAGDLVDRNPDGDMVVHVINELAIPCVSGNHDSRASAAQAWLRAHPEQLDPDLPTAPLKPETVDVLNRLPFSLHFSFDGLEVMLVHASPWDNTTYLFPNTYSDLFEKAANQARADLLVVGHTHVPMCVRSGLTWVINPGSVDRNRYAHDRTCAVVETFPFQVQFFDIDQGGLIKL